MRMRSSRPTSWLATLAAVVSTHRARSSAGTLDGPAVEDQIDRLARRGGPARIQRVLGELDVITGSVDPRQIAAVRERLDDVLGAVSRLAPRPRAASGEPERWAWLPFFEASFSNCIEGTEFGVDEARRIARLMVNAELSVAGQVRIVIPTGFRTNHLAALTAFSSGNGDGQSLHAVMDFAQRWVAHVDWATFARAVCRRSRPIPVGPRGQGPCSRTDVDDLTDNRDAARLLVRVSAGAGVRAVRATALSVVAQVGSGLHALGYGPLTAISAAPSGSVWVCPSAGPWPTPTAANWTTATPSGSARDASRREVVAGVAVDDDTRAVEQACAQGGNDGCAGALPTEPGGGDDAQIAETTPLEHAGDRRDLVTGSSAYRRCGACSICRSGQHLATSSAVMRCRGGSSSRTASSCAATSGATRVTTRCPTGQSDTHAVGRVCGSAMMLVPGTSTGSAGSGKLRCQVSRTRWCSEADGRSAANAHLGARDGTVGLVTLAAWPPCGAPP